MEVSASIRAFVPEISTDLWDRLRANYHNHADLAYGGPVGNCSGDVYMSSIRNMDTLGRIRRFREREHKPHFAEVPLQQCSAPSQIITDNKQPEISLYDMQVQKPLVVDNDKICGIHDNFEYDDHHGVCTVVLEEAKDSNISSKTSSSMNSQHSSTNADKYCTVNEWLRSHYELDSKSSVKRVTVYRQYYDFCIKNGITPVNSACLGKALRSVFPNIKTRRLGVRGESRYHYCGIKFKNTTPQVQEVQKFSLEPAQENGQICDLKQCSVQQNLVRDEEDGIKKESSISCSYNPQKMAAYDLKYDDCSQRSGTFLKRYKEHCADVAQNFKDCNFSEIEVAISSFWKNIDGYEDIINTPVMIENIRRCDLYTYSSIIYQLTSDGPIGVSSKTLKCIRHVSRKLVEWISAPLGEHSQLLKESRVNASKFFIQRLMRHERLACLSETVKSIIECPDCAHLAVEDWEVIEFESIKQRAFWMCKCDKFEILRTINYSINYMLRTRLDLKNWMKFLETLFDKFVERNLRGQEYIVFAKHFALKWMFYTSMIMGDVTMKCVSSFSRLYVIRLLLDECILYIVEKRILGFPTFLEPMNDN